jgi:hypothetical protein
MLGSQVYAALQIMRMQIFHSGAVRISKHGMMKSAFKNQLNPEGCSVGFLLNLLSMPMRSLLK